MKTKKFKSILLSVVGILYVLVGLLTGGVFFASTNAATTNVLDAIRGYDATHKKYSYIYLGEYPQEAVLECINGPGEGNVGWDTYTTSPSFTDGSLDVEQTIKSYIEEMCEQYYNQFLFENTSNSHYERIDAHFTKVGIVWGKYDWQTSTVLTFYPQENYETKHLYFDAKTGYYTLKTNVTYSAGVTSATPGDIAYPAGTKFHAYNSAVDSYNKRRPVVTNGVAAADYYNENQKINSPSHVLGFANKGLWKSPITKTDSSTESVSYNYTVYGNAEREFVYLYVVQPIKWRVLSVNGTTAFLLSDVSLDAMSFEQGSSNEWKFSFVRPWLNGEDAVMGYNGKEYVYQTSNRTFFDVAFTHSIQSAILETEITQEAKTSTIFGNLHYYDVAYAEENGVSADLVEARPTTSDKVFLIRQSDYLNAAYGLGVGVNGTSYNTDYSVALGNFAASRQNLQNQQNIVWSEKNNYSSGHWFFSTAMTLPSWNYLVLGSDNTVGIAGTLTYGVRPAMYVDLSKLDVASISVESNKGWLETDGVLPNDSTNSATLGSQTDPIKLDYQTQLLSNGSINTSVVYSFADESRSFASIDGGVTAGADIQSIKNKMGGSWNVDSITDNGDFTYSHVIRVNYVDQPAGSYLVAKVVDSQTGNTIAMAPITNLLTNSSNDTSSSAYFVSGSTYFEITRMSNIVDYKVIVYACCGGELVPANIYVHIDGNTSIEDVSSLIGGFNSSLKLYDYVYLGEYPQIAVHRKITSSSATNGYAGAITYGTFTTDSVNVTNKILLLIDELVDKFYYGDNLQNEGGFESWINLLHNSQGIYRHGVDVKVEKFYPTSDFETDSLYFDSTTGYYTLKVPVSSGDIFYDVGTKFHTYNNTIDVLQKYGYYTKVNNGVPSTTTYSMSGANNDTSIVDSTVAKEKQSYTVEDATTTYLFEVKPIKWRVVETEGNHLTLLANDILDSIKFNFNHQYGNEWAFSTVRGWLNGLDENLLYYETEQHVQYLVGRSFLDQAFSSNVQKAIVPYTKVQDTYAAKPNGVSSDIDYSGSYYNGKLHYYNLATAEAYGGVASDVEPSPQAYDKIWLPTFSKINSVWVPSSDLVARTMYNSDYSIATGNKDYSLNTGKSLSEPNANGAWMHNTRENKIAYISNPGYSNNGLYGGGEYMTSSAYVDTHTATRSFAWDAGLKGMTVTELRGITPCLTIDLTALDLSSVTHDSYAGTIDQSAGQGTFENPVDAMKIGQLSIGASASTSDDFVVYSINGTALGNVQTEGSWKVVGKVGIDNNSDGTDDGYKYTISVDYGGLYTQGFLAAKVLDKYGRNVAFATIANGKISTRGTTYFTFEGEYSDISDYIVEIYVGIGTNLVGAGIYQEGLNGQTKIAGTIFLDPVRGSDNNVGLRAATPIKSINKLKQIAGNGATVVLMDTIVINNDMGVVDIDLRGLDITFKRGFDGPIFKVDGQSDSYATLNLNNFKIDGTYFIYREDARVNYPLKVTESAEIEQTVISSNYANVKLVNCVLANNESTRSSSCIMAKNTNLYILESTFDGNKSGAYGGAIYIDGGSIECYNSQFKNNSCTQSAPQTKDYVTTNGGAMWINDVTKINIDNCYFAQNNASWSWAGSHGGAIYVYTHNATEDIYNYTISNCVFDANMAFSGGAVHVNNAGGYSTYYAITDCQFVNNITRVSASALSATYLNLNIDNCLFEGNYSYSDNSDNCGCVGFNSAAGKLNISNSQFIKNISKGDNSIVYVITSESTNIENCDFIENSLTYSKSNAFGGALSIGEQTTQEATILNCRFIGNTSKLAGGALFIGNNAQNILIENSIFDSNQSELSGGAIANLSNNLRLVGCNFVNNKQGLQIGTSTQTTGTVTYNSVTANGGGAVLSFGDIVIEDCVFDSNVANSPASYGGAVRVESTAHSSLIINSNFIKNVGISGGGLSVAVNTASVSRQCVVDGCYFEGNRAQVAGGIGLSGFDGGDTFEVLNSTFISNRATNGNGGAIYSSAAGVVSNSYFEKNTASNDGGAVHVGLPTRIFESCVFVYNIARHGGAISSYTKLDFGHGIKVLNNVSYASDITGAVTVNGYHLVDIQIGKEELYIYNNYTNLKDSNGTLVTTVEQLEALLDSNGDIVPRDDTKQANLYLGSGSNLKLTVAGYGVYAGKIGLTVNPTNLFTAGEVHKLIQVDWQHTAESIVNLFEYQAQSGERVELFVSTESNTSYICLKLKTTGQLFYTASDYIGMYDGTEHTISVKVYDNVTHTIKYGLEEGTYNLDSAPQFADAGKYTVYYQITASGYSTITGSSVVSIQKAKATITVINAVFSAKIGQKITSSQVLNQYISGLTAFDYNGNALTGDLKINTGLTIAEDTASLSGVVFYPHNSNYSASATLTISVKIEYLTLYYGVDASGNGYFSPVAFAASQVSAAEIANKLTLKVGSKSGATTINLESMVNFLSSDATLYFTSRYNFASAENITIDGNKNITFTEIGSSSSGVLKVNENIKASVVVRKGSSLTINVNANSIGTALLVNGSLSMVGNIEIVGGSRCVLGIQELATGYFEEVVFMGSAGLTLLNKCAITNNGNLTLNNCLITNYTLAGDEGHTIYSVGTLTLNNTAITKNSSVLTTGYANSAGPGVVINDGGKLYAYNSNFSYNQMKNSTIAFYEANFAGNLHVGDGSFAYLENCEISYGRAHRGAGVHVGNDSTLKAVNTKIENNIVLTKTTSGVTSSFGYGAGIFVGLNCVVEIIGGSISNNIAHDVTLANKSSVGSNGCGGGIFVDRGSLTLDGGVVVQNNFAAFGGAIYIATDKEVNLNNCIIQNNSIYHDDANNTLDVFGEGGAIYQNDAGILNLNAGCQIINNTASMGSAVRAVGSSVIVNIRGAIISGNHWIDSKPTSDNNWAGIINVTASTVSVYDGSFYGNTTTDSKGKGYVFKIENGTINMYGGKVSRNSTGGIFLIVASGYSGNVNLYGGEISHNKNGIQGWGSAVMLLDGCTIVENQDYDIKGATPLTVLSGKANVLEGIKTAHLFGGEIGTFDNASVNITLNLGKDAKLGSFTTSQTDSKVNIVSPLTGKANVNLNLSDSYLGSLTDGKLISVPKTFSIEQIKDLFNYMTLKNSNYVFDTENFVEDTNCYYIKVVEGTSSTTDLWFYPDSSSGVNTWQKVLDEVAKTPTIKNIILATMWTIDEDFELLNSHNLEIKFNQKKTIYIEEGVTVKFSNFSFSGKYNNYAVYIINRGNLIIDNCHFKDAHNTLYTESSGTVWGDGYGGAIQSSGNLVVTNSTFENNIAAYGGAIAITNGSLTVDNCIFKDNNAFVNSAYTGSLNSYGGAIYIYSDVKDITATITNSTFDGNYAHGKETAAAYGGAICASTKSDSSIKGNQTEGGYKTNFYINLNIDNCTFEGNYLNNSTTASGGAVFAQCAEVCIINSKFVANRVEAVTSANAKGGAINLFRCNTTLNNLIGSANSTNGTGAFLYFESTHNNLLAELNYSNILVSNNKLASTASGSIDYINNKYSILLQNIEYNSNSGEKLLFIVSDKKYFYPAGENYVAELKMDNIKVLNNDVKYGVYISRNNYTSLSNMTFENNTYTSLLFYLTEIESSENIYSDVKLSNIYMLNNLAGGRPQELNLAFKKNASTARTYTLSNIVIENCLANSAIKIDVATGINVTINIDNLKIINAKAAGIYSNVSVSNYISNTAINITNSTLVGSKNTNISYGMILTAFQTINIDNVYVSNFNSPYDGGGICITKARNVTISNSYIYNNSASSEGGGIYVKTVSTNTLEILNCHIFNNVAKNHRGGGVYVYAYSGDSIIKNCHIYNNSAQLAGGGLYSQRNLKVYSCTIENNSVYKSTELGTYGIWETVEEGSIFALYGGGGTTLYSAYIYDCVFRNNYSAHIGGGLYCYNAYEVENILFEGNSSAGNGAGLLIMGGVHNFVRDVTIKNSTCGVNAAYLGGNASASNPAKIFNLKIVDSVTTKNVLGLRMFADIYDLYIANSYGDGGAADDCVLIDGNRQVDFYNAKFENNNNIGRIVEVSENKTSQVFNNCKFVGNNTKSGLVYINAASIKPTVLVDCVFAGNTTSNPSGLFTSSGAAGLQRNFYISGCEIYGNTNTGDPGGSSGSAALIYLNADARFVISNTKFYDNLVNYKNLITKCAIFNNGGELLLDNCILGANIYAEYNGGAATGRYYQTGIHTTNNGYTMIRNTIFEGKASSNYAVKSAEGILHFEKLADECNLENVTFSGFNFGDGCAVVNYGNINLRNIKTKNNAGTNGLILQNYATAKISGNNTIMTGNVATGNGGVIYNHTGANLVVLDGLFKVNQAYKGGAIYNDVGANLTIMDGEFSSNFAKAKESSEYDGFGGSIYNLGILTINGGEISNNIADSGAGVYNLGTMTVNDGEFSSNKIVTAGGAIYNGQDTVDGTTYTASLVVNYSNFIGNSNYHNKSTDTITSYGLAIANYNASLNIFDAKFENNDNILNNESASTINKNVYGGVLYVEGHNSIVNIYGGEWILNKGSMRKGLGLSAKGVVVNIKNTRFIFQTTINQPAIYAADSTTLNISDCSFVIEGRRQGIFSDGLIRGDDASNTSLAVSLKNCHFKIVDGALFNYLFVYIMHTVTIENCLFEGATNAPLVHCEGNLNILNSKISNITFGGQGALFQTAGGYTVIDGCEFSRITSSQSLVSSNYSGYLTISNTKFINNTLNGSVSILAIPAAMSPVQIINVTITGNIINGTGGGIYVGKSRGVYIPEVSVEMLGNNTIQNNKFVAGGGIYFNENAVSILEANDKLIVGNGGKLIVDNNYLIDGSGNILTNQDGSYKQSNLSITSKVNYGGRTHKIYLIGGLASGSRIGLNMYQTEDIPVTSGSIAIYGDANKPITTKDLSFFNYDNDAYELRLIGGNIELYSPSVAGQGVVVSDKVVFADGGYYGFEASDFRVVGASGEIASFNVLFAKTQDGEYSNESPTYANLGSYTIWYKIVDGAGNAITGTSGEPLEGSVTLRIVNKVLSLVEAPVALLSKGATLASARFMGGLVISDGYPVAGTWTFTTPSTVPTGSGASYDATFTAASQGTYVNTITTKVAVDFAFNRVEYTTKDTVVGFYSVQSGVYTNTGFETLSQVIPYIADGGYLQISQTYTFQASEQIEACGDLTIVLLNEFKSTAFKVDGTSSISVSFLGGKGSIKIDGESSYKGNKDDEFLLFDIDKNSTLTLGDGVSIVNFIKNGLRGFIVNNGTLNLNGANFKNNKTCSHDGDVFGGVIYNCGTLNITAGNFVSNAASAVETRDSSINNSCYGGFIYNEKIAGNVGSVYILGGTFNQNSVGQPTKTYGWSELHPCLGDALGGVLYSNGGSVSVQGGFFARNNALISGGVVANAGGKIMLNGGQMVNNTAGVSGGAVYNDESVAGGTIVYNGTLISLNSLASDITVGSAGLTNINSTYIVLVGTISLVIAVAVLYMIMHAKHKGKKYNKR